MPQQFPWYELVETFDLEQGDLITECPVIVPTLVEPDSSVPGQYDVTGTREIFNVAIMTQSCDLANDKVDMILVCPYFTITQFLQDNAPDAPPSRKADAINSIRKGQRPGYYLMPKCDIDGHEHEPSVFVFHQIYTIPKKLLLSIVESQPSRVRILPPYREHLAQAFARFFMRVGLPIDIPAFSPRDFLPDT